ncbi:hypothetical protein P691DRAFT_807496 [Macrolepiota fuliginosa MF-IS2]|uniref:Uncharacterized protein n=1 Tax=Macrolepiota fuliginosa MF-IS2 TaxID=1400762 RepID=A0A9P6BYL0_9AGAR|nr:hypothetical protein P691DRAFT_807496 [Macrolepiota fuliginosa MF-IS2]
MLASKGHIQPHHTNLPRRRLRTRSPPGSSSIDKKHNVDPAPEEHPTRLLARSSRESTDSTRSTMSSGSDKERRPSPERGSSTPLTSPSDVVLPADAPPDKFPLAPAPIQTLPEAADDPTLPSGFQSSPKIFPDSSQPRLSSSGARGHLEPHVTNLPRRLSRAQKERDRVRRRCLQEFIVGSGVWIALNSGDDGDDIEDELVDVLTDEEKKDRDWMWQEIFGYTGVIRVRMGRNHGECQVVKTGDDKEELWLVIGQEEAKSYDDIGISTLADSQFESAAAFLIEHLRRNGGKGKILITVPPSRPVEAISIALFALSLPSTLSPSLILHHAPSYLSQLRFLPGIVELEQSQEVDIDIDIATDDSKLVDVAEIEGRPEYTLIQLALWHIHDLPPAELDDERGGLKVEWRGALSLDGIDRLENLTASR